MADGPVLALVLAILGLGLSLLLGGAVATLQWARVWRRRRATPQPLDLGLVALDGTTCAVEDHPPTAAPLSGEPACCVTIALERDAGAVSRPAWQEVQARDHRGPFGLETPAGTVRVDPAAAVVDLGSDETVVVESDAAPEDLRDALHGFAVTRSGGHLDVGAWELDPDERYRLIERRLDPGDTVAVTGRLDTDPTATATAGSISGPPADTWRSKLLSIPFVVADDGGESASYRLRNRALVGLVLGMPPTLLALVLLFPPALG